MDGALQIGEVVVGEHASDDTGVKLIVEPAADASEPASAARPLGQRQCGFAQRTWCARRSKLHTPQPITNTACDIEAGPVGRKAGAFSTGALAGMSAASTNCDEAMLNAAMPAVAAIESRSFAPITTHNQPHPHNNRPHGNRRRVGGYRGALQVEAVGGECSRAHMPSVFCMCVI